MVKLIFILAFIVIAVISLVIGLIKGYTNTKTWALEFFFAALISIFIYSLAYMGGMANWGAALIALCTAIDLLLAFSGISKRAKKFINKRMIASRMRSYYKMYGEQEENKLKILDAIELNDKKAYAVLTNRKFKESNGAAGWADRICGAIALAAKGIIVSFMVSAIVLILLQFTQLGFVTEGGALYSVYTSGAWKAVQPYMFDFFLVAILQFAIRAGYRSGLLNSLWSLAVLGLIIGMGYLAYYLAFRVDTFISLAESFNNNVSFCETAADYLGMVSSVTGTNIAQAIICFVVFVVGFIFICIASVVVSGIISRAREGKIVSTADGVCGAVIFVIIALVVLMIVGAFLYTFNDLSVMDIFNRYAYNKDGSSTALFTYIYDCNPFNDFGFIANLQDSLRSLFNS